MKRRLPRMRRELRSIRKYQGGWVQILYWLVATILTIVLTPKPAAPKPQALEDLDLPTAEEDRDLPVIFGKVRITGLNLTWHGNFGTNKIKKSSLFSSSTIGYRYFLGMMMHLCRGPVDSFSRIEAADKQAWAGNVTNNSTVNIQQENLFGGEKVEGGLWGAVDFMFGGMTQVCNTYLQGHVDPPYPGFRGVAGLVYRQGAQFALIKKFRAGGGGYIGTNGYVKPWAVTATRVLKGWHNDVVWYPEAALVDGGMNPIHAIYEALTNPLWGANNPSSLIDDTNFRYCADVCKDENLGITMMWAHSTKAEEFIQNILDHIAAALGVASGKYVITMIRGNYDPADLLLFNNDNMVEITEFQRRSWGETVNELTVAFTDATTGKLTDITVQDLGNIAAQKVRIPDKIDRSGFRNVDVIKVVAGRELLSRSTPLAKIGFITNRTAYRLRKYDVFRVQRSEPEYGLTQETVFRVVDVRKGNLEKGRINITAVEDIYALEGIEYNTTPAPPADVPTVELPEDGPDNSGTVTSTSTTAPPSLTNLTDGQRFLVPSGATGDWAGHAGQIAEWDEDSEEWIFIDVPDGTTLHDDESGGDVEVYAGEAIPKNNTLLTTKGDLLSHDGTSAVRVGVGPDGTVPIADSTAAAGWAWGSVDSGGSGDGGSSLLYYDATVPGGNTIANTAAETTFTSSYQLPLNVLEAGVLIRGRVQGTWGTAASAGTLRIRVKIGSTTVLDTTAVTVTNSVTAGRGWDLGFLIGVTTIGTSGQVEAQGVLTLSNAATTALQVALANAAKVSVDIGSPRTLTITAQWGTANASNTITLRHMALNAESVGDIAPTVQPVSMLHFEGLNNSTTFVDSARIQWAVGGDAKIDTSQFKYGGSSMRLDGTGDFLESMTDEDFRFGTGDFTIECWVRFSALGGNNFAFTWGGGWGVYAWSGQWALYNNAGSNLIIAGTSAINIWYHVALVRSGTNMMLFVNGALLGTVANSTDFSIPRIRIGGQPGGIGYMNGWVDEFRVHRAAVYTSAFVAPTAAFADPTPTLPEVFALHMNGADASTTFTDEVGRVWTPAGNAQIDTAQSKFGGASALFDGTGDWLTSPHTTDAVLGNNRFTAECWVRFAIAPAGGLYTFMSQWEPTGNQRAWIFGINANTLRFLYSTNGSGVVTLSVAWTPAANTWYHVAVTRNGVDLLFFINGTLVGTQTIGTDVIFTSTTNLQIGVQGNGSDGPMNGWLDEVRLTKGHCRYLADFLVPTSEFPAVLPLFSDPFDGSALSGSWLSLNTSGRVTAVVSGGMAALTLAGLNDGAPRFFYRAAAGAPTVPRRYRLQVGAVTVPNFAMAGIALRNSTTGNYYLFGKHQAQLGVLRFNNNYIGTDYISAAVSTGENGWLEIVDTGTNVYFNWSSSGASGSFVQVFTATRAAFIGTPDQIMFGFFDGQTSASMNALTFEIREGSS